MTYTEGVCGDGATILKNGVQINVTEILSDLNQIDTMEKDIEQIKVAINGLIDNDRIVRKALHSLV